MQQGCTCPSTPVNPSSSILHVELRRQKEWQQTKGRRRHPCETVPSDVSHRYFACLNMPVSEIQPGKQRLSKAPGITFPLLPPGEKTLQAFNQAAITSSTFHFLQITRHWLTHCTIKTPNQSKPWEKSNGVRGSRNQVMEEGRPVGGWATRIQDVRVNIHGSACTRFRTDPFLPPPTPVLCTSVTSSRTSRVGGNAALTSVVGSYL